MNNIMYDAIRYLFFYPKFLYACYRLHRLGKPIVSVFGGKYIAHDSLYYQSAFKCAQKLAQHNITILTGGGPGIMEAAICGAYGKSLGVGIYGVDVDYTLVCKGAVIRTSTFAMRKHFLIEYSHAFIIFPGGIGTLDELFEVLNLIKLKKLVLAPMPVILFGKAFWDPFIHMLNHLIEQEVVLKKAFAQLEISDDVDWIVDKIISHIHLVKK